MSASSSTSSPDMEQPCQTCGSRPARNFICQIIHGQQTNLVLCDACLRSQSVVGGFPTLDGTQTCFYCGGVATSASMNQAWEFSSRQQRYHYSCFRCTQLYDEFVTEGLSSISDGLPPEQQLQIIEQITRDTDQRVRERVRSDAQ